MNEQENVTAALDRDLAAMNRLARRITEQIGAGPAVVEAVHNSLRRTGRAW